MTAAKFRLKAGVGPTTCGSLPQCSKRYPISTHHGSSNANCLAHRPATKMQASDTLASIIGNFPRRTPVRDLHMAFKIPYVYDYITKLCRQQAVVIQDHANENVRNIGQGEARHRKYTRLKLGAGQAYDCKYCIIVHSGNGLVLLTDWQMTDPTSRQRGRPIWTGL
jgi:hypothetical protein